MKTKQNSKQKKTISKRKIAAIVAISILGIATIANSLILGYLFLSQRISADNTQITNLIIRAVDQLNKPAVIEPQTGKVYLPDAKLVLPPTSQELGRIAYMYSPMIEGIKEEVNVVSVRSVQLAQTQLLNRSSQKIEVLFEAVPKLQACSRGVRIGYELEDDNPPLATKKLSNNKTAYFYTEALCKSQKLVEYVQQIDSY